MREHQGPSHDRPRICYLRWTERRGRDDEIAAALGAQLVSVPWRPAGDLVAPVRYLQQFVFSLLALRRRRPDAVVARVTHPFCGLAAACYCAFSGAAFINDCHNGPFAQRIWRTAPFRQLNRWLFRRATLNLVHNEQLRRHVTEELGLRSTFMVLHDAIPDRPAEPVSRLRPAAAVLGSFGEDEPVGAVLEAARELPDVHFSLTGDRARAASFIPGAPRNVEFTDYLADADYDSLLAGADVAVVLSSWEHVLTCGCHEALGAGVPIVVTDSEAARDYLRGGAVFVENEPESIAAGIRSALKGADRLRAEAAELRGARQRAWAAELEQVRRSILEVCRRPKVAAQ
jgi:glycosyltransferase involved in cell wall biosynthesis